MAKNAEAIDSSKPVVIDVIPDNVMLSSEIEAVTAVGGTRLWDKVQSTIDKFKLTHGRLHFGAVMGFGTVAMGAMVGGPATGHPEAMLLSLGFLPAAGHWAVCYSREQAEAQYGKVKFNWRKQTFVPKITSPE